MIVGTHIYSKQILGMQYVQIHIAYGLNDKS